MHVADVVGHVFEHSFLPFLFNTSFVKFTRSQRNVKKCHSQCNWTNKCGQRGLVEDEVLPKKKFESESGKEEMDYERSGAQRNIGQFSVLPT